MIKLKPILLIVILFSVINCKKDPNLPDKDIETPDWSEDTHSNSVPPNYSLVFGPNNLLKVDIVILASDWAVMQSDLNSNIRPGNPPPPVNTLWEPVWVPCSLKFNGKEWYSVGIRFKGNSSLKTAVGRGIKKLSFKLDFDEFEEIHPSITDQRFYGFKQLSLSNGFDDQSFMREKLADDLFRRSGIAAAHSTYCEVWIDYGQGSKYYGLYTLIEEVDDTVIETQFTEGGNLYKPEGTAGTLAAGTFNTSQMYKKTNEETGDYSDVLSLYNIINSSLRISEPEAWKGELGKVFDIPYFLKWLAINTVIQNWDTYGKMNHNYYLYNNPVTEKLTWIPWDNNESLNPGKQGGALSLSMNEVKNGWPLIRYLLNFEEFRKLYTGYVDQFTSEIFTVSYMYEIIDNDVSLIKKSALAELSGYTFLSSSSAFNLEIEKLKSHIQTRQDSVRIFLRRYNP